MIDTRPANPTAALLLRPLAGLAGLLALWTGCGLANTPIPLGGPMGVSFDAPVGVVLVLAGVTGVALGPPRAWRAGWLLAGLVALVSAGPNFWRTLPIEDGAFQSLRAGVPDPTCWPAPAFLHVLAFAPAGIALGAVLPGARRPAPFLAASVVAVAGSILGLDAFLTATPVGAAGTALVAGAGAASSLLLVTAARTGHPVLRAIAGQAVTLAVLCLVLRVEWARVV